MRATVTSPSHGPAPARLTWPLCSPKPAARDLASATARALADTHLRKVNSELTMLQADATGLDLSGLPDIGPADLNLLVGVIWDNQTIWPPALAEFVRPRSREIRTGVYQVREEPDIEVISAN